ncbi:MAG: hypothetical protein NE334_18315 [Lentisphaeraceae bacterium]|nr:hypothetical protein [Lentisphaeraceae bacterium]
MNLNSSYSNLLDLNKQLQNKWKEVQSSWSDSNAQKFEREFISPLIKQLELSLNSISEIENTFKTIKEDFPNE